RSRRYRFAARCTHRSLCFRRVRFTSFVHVLLLHLFFFFMDTVTTEIYTLSLHDALPIWKASKSAGSTDRPAVCSTCGRPWAASIDRKSTRLNSSHVKISYAVFCLKKKTRATGSASSSD